MNADITDKDPSYRGLHLVVPEEVDPFTTIAAPDIEGLPQDQTVRDLMNSISDALLGEDETQSEIAVQGLLLTALLISKNRSYGNSALAPLSVFAKGISPKQRMAVRMDDKVNRLANGVNGEDGEDAFRDLAGYLLLWLVGEALDDRRSTLKP